MDLSALNSPARVAALMAGASSLLAGLVPAIANLDTKSTAGVIGGIVAVLGVYSTWAKGRRQHEAFQAGGVQVPWPPDPEVASEADPESTVGLAPVEAETIVVNVRPARKRPSRAKPKEQA